MSDVETKNVGNLKCFDLKYPLSSKQKPECWRMKQHFSKDRAM
jgi:hypothetical protein